MAPKKYQIKTFGFQEEDQHNTNWIRVRYRLQSPSL